MARLAVQAMRGTVDTVETSQSKVSLCVSVTDAEGNPVSGLSKTNFELNVLDGREMGAMGEGPVPVGINNVVTIAPEGFYGVVLEPKGNFNWGTGRMVLGLAVERKRLAEGIGGPLVTDKGQTLVGIGDAAA